MRRKEKIELLEKKVKALTETLIEAQILDWCDPFLSDWCDPDEEIKPNMVGNLCEIKEAHRRLLAHLGLEDKWVRKENGYYKIKKIKGAK